MLSVSLLAILLMALTDSDSAGKSLLWRIRRNRNSSVACRPLPVTGASSGSRIIVQRLGKLRRGLETQRRVAGHGFLQNCP
jgi:hypothetical protein